MAVYYAGVKTKPELDMNDLNIHTVNDLLVAAGNALDIHDAETLEQLRSVSEGWLQSEDEANAQRVLLNAMIDAAYTVREYFDEPVDE